MDARRARCGSLAPNMIRRLLTGVAVCNECGAIWELVRARPEEAVCCGRPLELAPEPIDFGGMLEEE